MQLLRNSAIEDDKDIWFERGVEKATYVHLE